MLNMLPAARIGVQRVFLGAESLAVQATRVNIYIFINSQLA